MDENSNKNSVLENYIIETTKYIDELIAEFGILHPLVDETIKKDLCEYLTQQVADSSFSSDESSAKSARYLERWMERWGARRNKAREEQKRIASASTACAILGGVAALGIAAFTYWCFRRKDPVQVLHSHSGNVSESININESINVNHSGYVTENINLRLNKF